MVPVGHTESWSSVSPTGGPESEPVPVSLVHRCPSWEDKVQEGLSFPGVEYNPRWGFYVESQTTCYDNNSYVEYMRVAGMTRGPCQDTWIVEARVFPEDWSDSPYTTTVRVKCLLL